MRIVTAAASGDHSLALTEDWTVFSWGYNDTGQLGLVRSGGNELLPQRVQSLSGIKVCAVTAGNFAVP